MRNCASATWHLGSTVSLHRYKLLSAVMCTCCLCLPTTCYIIAHFIMYAGVLGSGQEASSKEAFPFYQLVDEPQ